MRSRVCGSSSGDGASSTFWWRRWRYTHAHPDAPRCRQSVGKHLHFDIAWARNTNRSRNGVSSPNEDMASRRALTSASGSRAADLALTSSLAAAAGRRSDQHRIAHLSGGDQRVVRQPGALRRAPPEHRKRRPRSWRRCLLTHHSIARAGGPRNHPGVPPQRNRHSRQKPVADGSPGLQCATASKTPLADIG